MSSGDANSSKRLRPSGLPWAKETLESGINVYYIYGCVREASPLLIHFDLTQRQVAMCGCCLAVRTFPPNARISNISTWIRDHWRSFKFGKGAIKLHSLDNIPTELVTISATIAATMDLVYQDQVLSVASKPTMNTPVLLLDWLKSRFGDDNIARLNDYGDVRLCIRCLNVLKKVGACCPLGKIISAKSLTAGHKFGRIVYTEDSAVLQMIQELSVHIQGLRDNDLYLSATPQVKQTRSTELVPMSNSSTETMMTQPPPSSQYPAFYPSPAYHLTTTAYTDRTTCSIQFECPK